MSIVTEKQHEIRLAKSRIAQVVKLYSGSVEFRKVVRPTFIKILRQSLAVLEKHRMRCKELADAYEYLGYMEARLYEGRANRSRHDKGFALIEKSLRLRGRLPYDESFQPRHYVLDFYNLGVDYLYVKRYDDAIRCYNKALRLFNRTMNRNRDHFGKYPNHVFVLFGILLGLAESYRGAGQLRRAELALSRIMPRGLRKLTRSNSILEQMAKCLGDLHQVRTRMAAARKK